MESQYSIKLDLVYCQNCNHSGKVNGGKCRQCGGLGVAVFKHKKVLFWKYPLERFALSLANTRRIFNKIRFFVTVSCGLLLLGMSGYILYTQSELAGRLIFSASSQLFFWLSCVVFCYAVYRGIVQRSHAEAVENFDYSDVAEKKITSFSALLKLPHYLQKNIADSFTDEALAMLREAYLIADKEGAEKFTSTHLFLALLQSNRISNSFIRLGINPKNVADEILRQRPQVEPRGVEPRLEEIVYQIFFDSYELAYELHQHYVSVTEIFTATLIRAEELQRVLFDIGIEEQKLVNVIEWARIRERLSRRYSKLLSAGKFRSKQGMDRAMTAVATPFLNRLSEDLTRRAQAGSVEMCVARDKEIKEIFQVIEGGEHNVLLVGDFGVGKKSIIEGVAERMVEEDVPKRLYDKRLVHLSIPAMLSGTTPSGAAERLIMVLQEAARARNVILFINNIHELLGISLGDGDKSLDLGGTLADYLSGGACLVIASTTPEAYAKVISNSKLSTVFTRVDIPEMDENQAVQVLEAKAAYTEYKEKVFFAYEALEKSVEHSRRFLREIPLPGSALEVLNEAAAFARKKKGADSLVTAEEVGAVVSEKTHVPLTAISGDESSKLMHLEEEMHDRVVGQDEAVKLVSGALRRARAEIRSQKKPIANFLFLGPTGVGKTELAKTIAEVYFGGESNMIRLDMSEFQDTNSIYRLIGTPGEKGTGILTEAVRRKPFSLLLLDEIEKADKDVLNLFLQVMDDGRLTDSIGKVVDFTNVILIATSNAGTSYVQEQLRSGVNMDLIKDRLLHGGLKEYFRPEFLNRFDGIVLFEALNRESVKKVTSLLLKRIAKDLETKGIKIQIDDKAVEYFSEAGFDPEFGARPLRRILQEKVENQLAELIISHKLSKRDTVLVGEGGRIEVV